MSGRSCAFIEELLGRTGTDAVWSIECAGEPSDTTGLRWPADHNGCRNHDEVRLLADISMEIPTITLWTIREGGGLVKDRAFVIVGDLNTDPIDGESRHEIIERILRASGCSAIPSSSGAVEVSVSRQANERHRAPPDNDTADFFDATSVSVDYVLPSSNFSIAACGVFG